ncbi:hypothetical protein THARTR1_00906 [Trichoderma harzianum]|uniref:Uncharacterized protein n=1 Tax=Trichoderma harzianum TaxID=5544 RepID=A0A2K0UNQ8_TRIHA|nr:hypothetical protein THARTR1_00906 [Trichoderma harzianum]
MPQRQPNHSYGPPPPHQGYPNQYQQQHQQQYQDPRNPPLSHSHNQNLDARPMQHPLQTTQAPLPPPWPREQQFQTQGGGSRQYQTPPPLPPNGPLQHPFHPHHHHHMPPTQTTQATQLPSTSHILQAPWTPQPHQGSQAAQLQMAPQPFMTPQHHQVHQATAQMLQASGMPYMQPQMHPQSQHSPSTWSPASTRSQTHPHFTTHPLPSNEYPSSQHDWTSVRAGLHLTHLRSPRRCLSSRHQSPSAERTRYYQFFSKFILEPTEIRPCMAVTTLEFNISREDLDSLSLTTLSSESTGDEPIYEVPVSRHFNNSHRYRIRLCESLRQEEQPTFDPAEWSRTPTYWPPHFFFSFNDEPIHVRRKQHFHHDLPIELTDSLVEGKNTIKVNLPYFPQNLKENIAYFMAVELVTTLNHKSVRDLVISQPHITVEATKTEICRRLQKLETDEITIESDTLILSVTDIISSDKLVDIPVRGRECRHLECIDLQSWLDTRPSKWWQDEGEPSMVDSWACPICGMDARPCSLAVDDFFVEIRDKILESRKSNIKNIEMRADGTWSPIEEPDNDVGSSDRDGAQQR